MVEGVLFFAAEFLGVLIVFKVLEFLVDHLFWFESGFLGFLKGDFCFVDLVVCKVGKAEKEEGFGFFGIEVAGFAEGIDGFAEFTDV